MLFNYLGKYNDLIHSVVATNMSFTETLAYISKHSSSRGLSVHQGNTDASRAKTLVSEVLAMQREHTAAL